MERKDLLESVQTSTGEYVAGEVGIVDVEVVETTQWKCPNPQCGTRWRKLGIHTGVLKTCGACGARFFLRNPNQA